MMTTHSYSHSDPDTDVWDGDDIPDSGTNDDGSGYPDLTPDE